MLTTKEQSHPKLRYYNFMYVIFKRQLAALVQKCCFLKAAWLTIIVFWSS
jgi:hypothetical protein